MDQGLARSELATQTSDVLSDCCNVCSEGSAPFGARLITNAFGTTHISTTEKNNNRAQYPFVGCGRFQDMLLITQPHSD